MATQDPTVNYTWDLPLDGGAAGAWGAALNVIIGDDATGIDAIVKAVSDVADAALPLAGGTMTGDIYALTQRFVVSALGNLSGAEPLDVSAANFFHGTVTGTTTFSFTNEPAAGAVFLLFQITNGGAFQLTWPAEANWPGGTPPTFTASGVDVVSAYTIDAGVTWRLAMVHEDSS